MKNNGKSLEYWMGRGIKVLHTLPQGWKEKYSASPAPNGYKWVSNGKPMFTDNFEMALLKIN